MKHERLPSDAFSTAVELFKVAVAERTQLNLQYVMEGFVTDFNPTVGQLTLLRLLFQPLPITTLFSVTERANSSPVELVMKQLLHYIEVYGLDAPGLFQLEVSAGKIAPVVYIKAVSKAQLTDLVAGLIYANRPIADAVAVAELIHGHQLPYDINAVRNNELKVVLFDVMRDHFTSGDDAARYICYHATRNPMLIKSKQVIEAVQKNPVGERFLSEHILPLSQVFNRHERLIMACKNPGSASVVNKISKLSKKRHVPLHEPLSKHFISVAMKGAIPPLEGISLRDKFKYLNLIEYRMLGLPYDTYLIRNGKVWTEGDRKRADLSRLMDVQAAVLESLRADFAHLQRSAILLDPAVDYGLPISRKQTLGNLPFGTRVTAQGDSKLSAGIYWQNAGKSNQYRDSIDLDLSAINDKGERTGWGQWSGYGRDAQIVFSGDVTDARNGATEFMVIDPRRANRFGLMVNIFRGPEPCEAEIVVGYPSSSVSKGAVWQERTLLREKISLQSKQSVIGFLKDRAFVVYAGQLSSSRVSKGRHAVIDKGLSDLWTVGRLLGSCGVGYDTTPKPGVAYDHDLRREGFTLDKLERLFDI